MSATVSPARNLADLRVLGHQLLEVLPLDDLPAFVAELEALNTLALVRLLGQQTPQPAGQDDEHLTAGELGQIYNVGKSFFYELARQGRIPVERLGRYRRFNRAAFGEESDEWRGRKIVLRAEDTFFKGKPTTGLRVRPVVVKAKPKAAPEPEPEDDDFNFEEEA